MSGPFLAAGERGLHDRDAARVAGGQRAVDQALTVGGVALVEQDHPDGTRRRRVRGLGLERTRAALDQRDVAGRERGEVVGTTRVRDGVPRHRVGRERSVASAAARARRHEVDVDGRDGCRHVARIRLVHGLVVGPFDVHGRDRGRLLERRRPEHAVGEVVERLDHRIVSGRLEPLHHVRDRLVMPGQSGEPVAAVGIGDRLQGGLVLPDPRERDALQELLRRVVVPVVAGRRTCDGRYGRQPCDGDRGDHHR